jgi:hypothetical protein
VVICYINKTAQILQFSSITEELKNQNKQSGAGIVEEKLLH